MHLKKKTVPSIRSCFGQLLLEIFNFALSSLGFQVQILDPKAGKGKGTCPGNIYDIGQASCELEFQT